MNLNLFPVTGGRRRTIIIKFHPFQDSSLIKRVRKVLPRNSNFRQKCGLPEKIHANYFTWLKFRGLILWVLFSIKGGIFFHIVQ